MVERLDTSARSFRVPGLSASRSDAPITTSCIQVLDRQLCKLAMLRSLDARCVDHITESNLVLQLILTRAHGRTMRLRPATNAVDQRPLL